ncbi:UDP-glycosyltransferase 84B2-like [Brassica napus]|uniref:UDP-glycosyltransferase 84B2-like n=2 Tax=Brassica TaxID=3705 RepID=UPI0020790EBB|nr:UDP-glycosyltransferase 84B2-like [Brassica napus]
MKTNTFPEDLEDLNQTVDLPALPLLEVRDLPSFMLPSSGSNFNNLMLDFVDCLKNVKWVLVNSFYELESEIIDSMSDLKPIIPIGSLVSPFLLGADEDKTLDEKNLDLWRSDGDCMKWLDTQARSSVVYISFGSLLKWSENQVKSIATAMRNRGDSFLWVIRPKEIAQNVDILHEMVQEGQGVVIEWGPQERILSHVAISCFVTHCGWNSTMETVVTGVPVVAYPSWIDQPLDARLLVDVFGIGVRMRNDAVDGELKVAEVERCIEAVTEGLSAEDMRRRARELKQAARSALAPGGSSAQNLDAFIGYITSCV